MELADYIEMLNKVQRQVEELQDLIEGNFSVCTDNHGGFDVSVWTLREDDYADTHYHAYIPSVYQLEGAIDFLRAGAKLAKRG